jgi:predicted DNA binding CopG/RHH family protein
MSALQIFSDDYLDLCKQMSSDQIVRFLDDFRQLHCTSSQGKSKLISLKVPEDLLATFKVKSALTGTRYQTKIKQLMSDWVKAN